MQPVDWGQAWSIVGGGLLAVFAIMTLLAGATSLLGKFFSSMDKRKAAAAKAQEAKS